MKRSRRTTEVQPMDKENQTPQSSALNAILKKNVKRVKLVAFHWTRHVPEDIPEELETFMLNTFNEYFKNLAINYGIEMNVKDASWKLLTYCLLNDKELQEKNFAVVSAAAIHLTTHSQTAIVDSCPPNVPLGYSYLLNADKLIRKKSPDGLIHVYCEFLVVYSKMLKRVESIFSVEESSHCSKEETFLTERFIEYHQSFDTFKRLFDIFFKFEDKKYQEMMFKYIWLMFCYLSETGTVEIDDQGTIDVCALVSFAAMQVDQENRNSATKIIDELIADLKEDGQDFKELEQIKEKLENEDLINNIERIRKGLAVRFNVNLKRYTGRDLVTIERITKDLFAKKVFKYTELFKPFLNMPWPIFINSMDNNAGGQMGLAANVASLIEEFEAALIAKKLKFDGRIFIQEIKKPQIAIGRKMVDDKQMKERLRASKLAMMSVALKSKTQSGFSYQTPLHCKEFLKDLTENRILTNSMSFNQIEQKVLRMTDDPQVFLKNHKHIPFDPPMCEAMNAAITSLKVTESGEKLDLPTAYMVDSSVKLMFYIIDHLHEWYRTQVPSEEYAVLLLYDQRFHRALLAISCEILRFTYQLRTWSFENIVAKVGAKYVDIALLIPQIISVESSWVPSNIVKRLKEIEADVYDFNCWQDSKFMELFLSLKERRKPEKSELYRFYYYSISHPSESPNWKEIHLTVAQKITDFIDTLVAFRLEFALDSLQVRDAAELKEKAI